MVATNARFWMTPLASMAVGLLLSISARAGDLPTAKPEDVGVSSEKVGELSRYMQSLVDEGKIAGGVTMMARHGKVIHLEAVGMADREAGTPMQTDSIFRIASMTKPITSVAVMMLWEQGKLGLDDPVSKYIPEFKKMKVLVNIDPLKTEPAKREITIRHLLTHTAGFAYPVTSGIGPLYYAKKIPAGVVTSPVSLKQKLKMLAELPLSFHPGEKWQYGMSTDVLGRLVEVVSETTLDRFIEDRICKPLGMNDTAFKLSPKQTKRLVSAYIPGEGDVEKLEDGRIVEHRLRGLAIRISADYPYAKKHKLLSGGGGLCSTPADYMRFCLMLLNGGEFRQTRLLKEDTVKMMTRNQIRCLPDGESSLEFGFGFQVMPDSQGIHQQLRASYTWSGFWGTFFRISPRGDWVVIAMTQVASDGVSPQVQFPKYGILAAEAID